MTHHVFIFRWITGHAQIYLQKNSISVNNIMSKFNFRTRFQTTNDSVQTTDNVT